MRGALLRFPAGTIAILAQIIDLRSHVSTLFLLGSRLLLLLGAASAWAVIANARPQVGQIYTGWIWAAAMAALLPASMAVMALPQIATSWKSFDPREGILCLGMGVLCSLALATVLVAWLRRGPQLRPNALG